MLHSNGRTANENGVSFVVAIAAVSIGKEMLHSKVMLSRSVAEIPGTEAAGPDAAVYAVVPDGTYYFYGLTACCA